MNEELKVKIAKKGYKMTELGQIPQEWEVKKIKELYNVSTGSTPLRKKYDEYFSNGNIPWVKTLDLNDSYIFNTDEKITELALKETSCKLQKEGTVLIAMYGGFNQIGRTGILKINAATNQAICSLQPNKNIVPDFINYYLIANRERWKEVAASTRKDPNITKTNVENFTLIIPPKNVQQKIAKVLSTIDEQIEINEKLIEKTQELKKGLMQRLLTKGIGHDRFKNSEIGRIPEEWKVGKLGVYVNIKRGFTWKKAQESLEFEDGMTPVIRIGNIKKGLNINDLLYLKKVTTEQKEKYKLAKDYIVMIGSNGNKDRIGNCCIIENDMDFVYASFLIGLSVKDNNKIFPKFLYYYICSNIVQNAISESTTGTTGLSNLSLEILKELNLIIPSIEEQEEIALILSSVDEQISQYESKKEKLQELKKGLMQKLLTGEIRVKV